VPLRDAALTAVSMPVKSEALAGHLRGGTDAPPGNCGPANIAMNASIEPSRGSPPAAGSWTISPVAPAGVPVTSPSVTSGRSQPAAGAAPCSRIVPGRSSVMLAAASISGLSAPSFR
jgi:hypothetical protein